MLKSLNNKKGISCLMTMVSFVTIGILLSLYFSTTSIIFWVTLIGCSLIVATYKDIDFLYKHIIVIFIIAAFFLIFIYEGYINFYGQPYWRGGSDDQAYESIAMDLYGKGVRSYKSIKSYTDYSQGFEFVLIWIIHISKFFGGYHTIIYRLINVGFLELIGVLMVTMIELKDKREKIILLYIISIFPHAFYISAHIFRDTISSMLLVLTFGLLSVYKKLKRHQKIIIGISIICISAFGYSIRKANLLYIIAAVIINIFTCYFSDICFRIKSSLLIKRNKMSIFLLAVLTCIIVGFQILKVSGNINWILDYSVRYLNYYARTLDGRASQGILGIPLFPVGFFLRLFYGMCIPFPSGIIYFLSEQNIETVLNMFNSIGTLCQVAMIPFLVKGLKKFNTVSLMFAVTYFSVILTTFTFRHYIYVYPYMLYLMVDGFYNTDKRKRVLYVFIMLLIEVLLAIAYIGLLK